MSNTLILSFCGIPEITFTQLQQFRGEKKSVFSFCWKQTPASWLLALGFRCSDGAAHGPAALALCRDTCWGDCHLLHQTSCGHWNVCVHKAPLSKAARSSGGASFRQAGTAWPCLDQAWKLPWDERVPWEHTGTVPPKPPTEPAFSCFFPHPGLCAVFPDTCGPPVLAEMAVAPR